MTTVIELPQGNPAPWLEGIEGCAAHKLIESNDTVTRVVAGPGSGKTTCPKRRIQRLVQKEEVDPQKIFVGTFTRAIAKELRDALSMELSRSFWDSTPWLLEFLLNRCLSRDSPDQTDFPEHGTLGDKSNYKVVPRTRHCPLTHSNSPLS